MARLFTIEVDNSNLRVLMNVAELKLNAQQVEHLGLAVRDMGAKAQARAVRNVSGYPVIFDGHVFRVVPRTGALKGSIDMQWPYQGPLQAKVFVNGTHTAQPMQMGDGVVKPRPVADYAAAIEFGHGEIDLKKFMQGKTVPFFASRGSRSTGPFAVRGLTPVAGTSEGMWENEAFNKVLAGKGNGPMHFQRRKAAAYAAKRGGGTYFIAFRKVGKKGWIIPEAKPRPFLRAAATGRATQRDATAAVRQRLIELMDPDAANRPAH